MRKIDSAVLQSIARSLRLFGSGSPETEYDDGVLQQVLDVGPLIRRGGALGPTEGLWTAGIVNTHAAADSQSTSVNPYAIVAPASGFPSPIPEGSDVWIWGFSANLNVGVAGSGFLGVNYPTTRAAFGVTSSQQVVFMFNGDVLVAGVTFALPVPGYHVDRAVRVPRGTTIRWDTTSAAAGQAIGRFIIGVFPAGLGQDGVA